MAKAKLKAVESEPQGLLGETLAMIERRVQAGRRAHQSRLGVLVEIADGAGVNVEWLKKAAAPVNATPNPGVVFVQKVYDFLKAEEGAA